MNVRLISTTKAADHLGDVSPEALIIYIARVSSGREEEEKLEELEKLVRYLIRNKHWSPFEMASMCVEITTSRAIAHQILRHRSFSFQEFSQRYAKAIDMEPVELRFQAETNRQSSTDVVTDDTLRNDIQWVQDRAVGLYEDLLKYGVAKETARFILPLTTQTRLYMHGTVRSWLHYLQIRDDPHAQLEHQRIAQEIKSIFVEQFPITSAALEWEPVADEASV